MDRGNLWNIGNHLLDGRVLVAVRVTFEEANAIAADMEGMSPTILGCSGSGVHVYAVAC